MVKQTKPPITGEQLLSVGRRLLSLIVAIYLIVLLGRVVYQNYLVKRRIEQIQEDIKELKEDNQRLANLVTYYQTETFRELEARSQLGLKKPGETVIALPENSDEEPAQPAPPPATPTPSTPSSTPNYIKWWEYLFGSS